MMQPTGGWEGKKLVSINTNIPFLQPNTIDISGGVWLTSNMINTDIYADVMINADKYTDSMFNTKNF